MFEQILDFDSTARRYLLLALERYMRILGILLLLAGIGRSMTILGMVSDPSTTFLALSVERRIFSVFLTVFYLTASVGLWNTMSWGAVVWLLAAVVDIFVQVFFSGTFGISPISLIFHLITIGIYVTLIMLIRRAAPD